MDDSRYLTSGAILDASPLIYLAKLDAFDTIAIAGHTAAIPPSVYAEAALRAPTVPV